MLVMEQYMMAEKARLFSGANALHLIMATTDPKHIKEMGRQAKGFNDKARISRCYEIVVKGNAAKLSQNKQSKELLLSTGNMILAEASPFDRR